jgi:hypothetical protein
MICQFSAQPQTHSSGVFRSTEAISRSMMTSGFGHCSLRDKNAVLPHNDLAGCRTSPSTVIDSWVVVCSARIEAVCDCSVDVWRCGHLLSVLRVGVVVMGIPSRINVTKRQR